MDQPVSCNTYISGGYLLVLEIVKTDEGSGSKTCKGLVLSLQTPKSFS